MAALEAFNAFKKQFLEDQGYKTNLVLKAEGLPPNPKGYYAQLVKAAGQAFRERSAAASGKAYKARPKMGAPFKGASACVGLPVDDCGRHPRCNWVKQSVSSKTGKVSVAHCSKKPDTKGTYAQRDPSKAPNTLTYMGMTRGKQYPELSRPYPQQQQGGRRVHRGGNQVLQTSLL